MSLTEAEELELLELERERSGIDFTHQSATKNTSPLFLGKLFPEALQKHTVIGKGVGAILDVASLPTRGLGTLRGNDLGSTESNIFRPEINAAKQFIDKQDYSKPYVTRDGLELHRNPEFEKNIKKGIVETVGSIAGDPTLAIGGIAKVGSLALKGAKYANKQLGRLAQELTRIPEEALRLYGTGFGEGAKQLKAAANTQMKIADKMIHAIDNFDEYVPEKKEINQMLHQMPSISLKNVIKTLKSAKTENATVQSAIRANEKIDEILINLENNFPTGKVSAPEFRAQRMQLDAEARSAFNKDYREYLEEALVKARRTMADDLVDAALRSGNDEYIDLMKTYAQKLQTVDQLKGYIGLSSEVRSRRVQSFVDNLFGKNSENKQELVKKIGEIFGDDFLEQSKLARLASELGPEGIPGFISQHTTGKSLLGPLVGLGGIGKGLVSGDPAALATGIGALTISSPKTAAATLGVTDITLKQLAEMGKYLKPKLEKAKKIRGVSGVAAGVQNRQNKK